VRRKHRAPEESLTHRCAKGKATVARTPLRRIDENDCRIQNSEFRIQNSFQNSEFRNQNSELAFFFARHCALTGRSWPRSYDPWQSPGQRDQKQRAKCKPRELQPVHQQRAL